MRAKRVTLFTGHYGSGKTSLAVSYAMKLRAGGKPVVIADLDIVNPYFRTTDHREALAREGIRLVGSHFANSNLDIPSLPGELYAAVEDKSSYAVLDVGGDDRGAVALGRYAPAIKEEGDYEMIFVVNFFRPLTQTPEDALGVLREVEAACGIPCTGLVNNSNLGALTRAEDLLGTVERMETLADLAALPLLFTAANRRVYGEFEGSVENLFPIELF